MKPQLPAYLAVCIIATGPSTRVPAVAAVACSGVAAVRVHIALHAMVVAIMVAIVGVIVTIVGLGLWQGAGQEREEEQGQAGVQHHGRLINISCVRSVLFPHFPPTSGPGTN